MAATDPDSFLDRDGVLNAPATIRPSRARTAPCVPSRWPCFVGAAVLRDLTRAGFGLAIASNQPAAAKGRPRAPSCRRFTRSSGSRRPRRRRDPELAHLLPPRRGRLHLSEAGHGPARGSVRAESGLRPVVLVDGRRLGADVMAGLAFGVQTALVGAVAGEEREQLVARRPDADLPGSRFARPGRAPGRQRQTLRVVTRLRSSAGLCCSKCLKYPPKPSNRPATIVDVASSP